MIVAITGGTGFVGGHLLTMAVAAGHEVRALARRPQPAIQGVTWIEGSLDLTDSLARLVEGAEAVIHVAGVISGDREAFRIGNIVGTEHMSRPRPMPASDGSSTSPHSPRANPACRLTAGRRPFPKSR